MSNLIRHPYHLVDESPWPLFSSLAALYLTTGSLKWFHGGSPSLLFWGLLIIIIVSYQWWRDISKEAGFQGSHRHFVEIGIRYGILLFIASEVILFFSFFWTFFHRSVSPTIELGVNWPPLNINTFHPLEVPILNTIVLLSSGIRVTWAHHALTCGLHKNAAQGLIITIILGFYFTVLQSFEYYEASFRIADRVFGSVFFLTTGFHGLHVIVGSLFLVVCYLRLRKGLLSPNHHFGFEAAAWYWHFVDIVWLFVYIIIYCWGG